MKPESSNPRRPSRSRALRWSLAVIVCVCAVGFLADCQRRRSQTAGADEVQPVDVAQVVTDSVTTHIEMPGFLSAASAVKVVGRVNGTLLKKHYVSGQTVQAGDVLFTIEPTTYADEVRRAEAAVASAKSQYDYASSHYDAVCQALAADAVSKMEVDQARSAMEGAAASLKSANAALQTARINLGYCTVRATASGRITSATVDVGSYISGAGAPVELATIYDDTSVTGVFQVDQADQADITAAALDFKNVTLRFDEQLGHDYNGEITYTAPEVDRATGTTVIKVKVQNPYGELRDGMYCHAVFPSGFMERAMLVRNASIGTDQLGRYVYLVNDSDRVVYTPVEVGQVVNDSMRIILSGVKPGDRYVTKALLKVRDGMPVKPVEVK